MQEKIEPRYYGREAILAAGFKPTGIINEHCESYFIHRQALFLDVDIIYLRGFRTGFNKWELFISPDAPPDIPSYESRPMLS